MDAVQLLGLKTVFEPGKMHPRDWANPGRVRVCLPGRGERGGGRGRVKNSRAFLCMLCEVLRVTGERARTLLALGDDDGWIRSVGYTCAVLTMAVRRTPPLHSNIHPPPRQPDHRILPPPAAHPGDATTRGTDPAAGRPKGVEDQCDIAVAFACAEWGRGQ